MSVGQKALISVPSHLAYGKDVKFWLSMEGTTRIHRF
jgi:hypothetical protein